MKQVDMSDKAITARLKRAAQLRRLGLSLQKAKLDSGDRKAKTRTAQNEAAPPTEQKTK
jgi:hypothetical protein